MSLGSCHLGRPSAKYSSLLDLVFFSSEGYEGDKASTICHCKGGRFVSFWEAFGLVTCPLLFFTLPRSLKMPAKYYSLLDLVFFSPEGCECDRASICLLLLARVVGSCHLGRPSA